MRLSPCGARQNVEVDFDAGDRDISAGHGHPASGALYSLRQAAGRYDFPATRPDLYLPVRDDDHFLAATLAGFTHHLAPA